jgi:hypothetical protein
MAENKCKSTMQAPDFNDLVRPLVARLHEWYYIFTAILSHINTEASSYRVVSATYLESVAIDAAGLASTY